MTVLIVPFPSIMDLLQKNKDTPMASINEWDEQLKAMEGIAGDPFHCFELFVPLVDRCHRGVLVFLKQVHYGREGNNKDSHAGTLWVLAVLGYTGRGIPAMAEESAHCYS